MPLKYSIIAFDPGLTTGVCIIEQWDEERTFKVILSGVIEWSSRFQMIQTLVGREAYTSVVAERFTLYKNKAQDQVGADFPSCQVIGIIGMCMHLRGLDEPILYPASNMLRVEILPEHANQLHKSEHGRDAYKHARYELIRLQTLERRKAARHAS